MNYRLVLQLQEKAISVQHCCQVLALSRSGYYAAQQRWLRPPSVCPITVHLLKPIKPGSPTSLTSVPVAVGYSWPPCLTCILAILWAGRVPSMPVELVCTALQIPTRGTSCEAA